MTRNENLGFFDPDNIPITDFVEFDSDINEVSGEMIVTTSKSNQKSVGTISVDNREVTGASIDNDGHLVIQYNDGSEEVFGVVRGFQDVGLTSTGYGLLTGFDDNDFKFSPLHALFPLSIEESSTDITISDTENGILTNSRYVELSYIPSGTSRPLSTLSYSIDYNNLQASVSNNSITLPEGKYYVQTNSSVQSQDECHMEISVDGTTKIVGNSRNGISTLNVEGWFILDQQRTIQVNIITDDQSATFIGRAGSISSKLKIWKI